jgi:HEAT repeat protein
MRPSVQLFRRSRFATAFLAALCLCAVHCGEGSAERRASIYELRADPTPENVERIRSMLIDVDRDIRATALNALVGLEVEDSAGLALDGLRDEDGFVRATAAKLIGDIGDPAHVGVLATALLEDSDPVARQRAAESLEILGGEEALAGLASCLEDPMERVRLACIDGLRKLDPAFATTALLRLLAEDSAWEVRSQAARTLGLTGDPEVVEGLQAALGDPNEFVRSAVTNALKIHEELRSGKARSESGPSGV